MSPRPEKPKKQFRSHIGGNVVDLWERLADEDITVELGSDQTSLHNPWAGGYYPVGLSFEEAKTMMAEDPDEFRRRVQESLRRQVTAINKLTARGMYFFDYGNAFLLESSRAGADVLNPDGTFRYPSYVQDIMGPALLRLRLRPVPLVVTSGKPEDLAVTDRIAAEVLEEIRRTAPTDICGQLDDNIHWIKEAGPNHLVVGSQSPHTLRRCRRPRKDCTCFQRCNRTWRTVGPGGSGPRPPRCERHRLPIP